MANVIHMEDFKMSMNTVKRVTVIYPTLQRFLCAFEAVFGDADWPVTLDNLIADNLIDPAGTFLEPGVPDESANWHNRGALLAHYRQLRAELDKGELRAFEIKPYSPEELRLMKMSVDEGGI